MDATEGALEGIRVVELGVVIAGPATAVILADWGADVIKLEPRTETRNVVTSVPT